MATPPRRLRKRIIIPVVLLLLLVIVLGVAWVRGSWASSEARNPASSSEGPIAQLYQAPGGEIQVRTAMVVDQPPDKVWKKLTNYDHFQDVFQTLDGAVIQAQADGAKLTGQAHTPLGEFPVEVQIKHVEDTPEKRVAAWDSPLGDVVKNKGSFTLTPLPGDKTLLVYALEVEIARYPNFIVRNVLLSRQQALGQRLIEQLGQQ